MGHSEDTSHYGYVHETNLKDDDNPKVLIRSTRLPLALRLVLPSDASALLRIFTDKRNVEFDASCDGLDTLSAVEDLIIRWRNLEDPLTRLNLAVIEDGTMVGVSGMGLIYTRDEDGKRIADAGIMIDPDARGKGYAYESLRITIDYALRVLELDEVTVEMRDVNVAMRGLMEKQFGVAPTEKPGELKFGNEYSYRFEKEDLSSPCA